jgi:hypothetical protein
MVETKKCIIGGIIKGVQNGYCFKICFNDLGDAQRYKDFVYWIAKELKMVVDVNNGYYDDQDKYNYDLEGNEK